MSNKINRKKLDWLSNDLLENLKKETFFGNEIHHLPTKIKITYSPGSLELHIEDSSDTTSDEIYKFDEDYKILQYQEGLNGDIKDSTRHYFATNHFRRDPRYVLQNLSDVQNPSENIYIMKIYDDTAKENEKESKKLINRILKLNKLYKIEQFAELHLEDDFITKMVVKQRFASGKEKVFTDIDFYR